MDRATKMLRCVTFVTLVFCFASCGNATTCRLAPNSTSPKGYFAFGSVWFPTPKAPTFVGAVTGSDLMGACGKKCVNSKYGFYIRRNNRNVDNACYCLNGDPDYTKPEDMWGYGFYTKRCPKVKGPPPPRPPPPFTPNRCAVSYNSSNPYGFFYFQFSAVSGRSPFKADATNSVDVWPQIGASTRCYIVCKNYKWGFIVSSGKYSNNADCFCLKSAMTYELGGFLDYSMSFYSKSCPKKKGRHPPGVGKHPPGVGGHRGH